MGRVRVVDEIDAPPAEVWRVVEQIDRHVDWMADADVDPVQTDQTRGVGTRFECDTQVGPIRLDRHAWTITEWEPGTRWASATTGWSPARDGSRWTRSTSGRRTPFTWNEELRFPWWLAGRLGGRVGGQTVMRRSGGATWSAQARRPKSELSAARPRRTEMITTTSGARRHAANAAAATPGGRASSTSS